MEIHRNKIMHFSKIVFTLLKIAFVACIVAGAVEALMYLLSVSRLPTDVVSIAGYEVEAPLLFQFRETKVYLPVMWESDFDLTMSMDPIIGFGDVLLTALTAIGLRYALSVFKILREDGSPFREEIVVALKKLAIALLCLGAVSGVIPLLAAGIVWVLCLIFSYGSALQNESDTTL